MNRPTWDATWLDVASTMAQRSKCIRAKVGAVIVDTLQRVVSTGYNGPPAGLDVQGPCSGWCSRAGSGDIRTDYVNCPSVHAEENAITYADRSRMEGGTIYITRAPCFGCAKVVANSGVRRIVFMESAADAERTDVDGVVVFLRTCGLDVEKV